MPTRGLPPGGYGRLLDGLGKATFLPLVDIHHALPIGGDFGERMVLAKVNQRQQIFLETGPTETNGSLEELWADARIRSHHRSDFRHFGAGLLTKCRERINGRNALGQKGVRSQLG